MIVPGRRFGSAQGARRLLLNPSRLFRLANPAAAAASRLTITRCRWSSTRSARGSRTDLRRSLRPPDPRAPSRAPTSSTFLRSESRSHTASRGDPGLAPPQQDAVLLSGLLVPSASIFVRRREPGHLSCCASSHRNRGRHDANHDHSHSVSGEPAGAMTPNQLTLQRLLLVVRYVACPTVSSRYEVPFGNYVR